MLTLKSNTKKGKKYFFEEFGFRKESIENGGAHPKAKGKLISSLELSLDSDNYVFNKNFKEILEDSCPLEITSHGIKSSMSYIKAFGWSDDDKIMYVHTIQE